MLLLISQLIGRSIVTFDAAETLGVLSKPIIDPANGKLAGYFMSHGMLRISHGIVASNDIVGYDARRIIVQRADIIRQADDEPKIALILGKKIAVYRAEVLTESGKFLGRANDLLLDTDLAMVVKYYVHGVITDRIIAAEHVIVIDKRGIIVDDMAPTVTAAAAELSS